MSKSSLSEGVRTVISIGTVFEHRLNSGKIYVLDRNQTDIFTLLTTAIAELTSKGLRASLTRSSKSIRISGCKGVHGLGFLGPKRRKKEKMATPFQIDEEETRVERVSLHFLSSPKKLGFLTERGDFSNDADCRRFSPSNRRRTSLLVVKENISKQKKLLDRLLAKKDTLYDIEVTGCTCLLVGSAGHRFYLTTVFMFLSTCVLGHGLLCPLVFSDGAALSVPGILRDDFPYWSKDETNCIRPLKLIKIDD
ncbi:hypothetical protein YC2023_036559 [Brassica napus]